MTRLVSNIVRIAAVLLSIGCAHANARSETILFVGNSFTFGAGSPVQRYRTESVIDLNQDGVGGVPALFKTFALQAGLDYEVSLETVGGANLDLHYETKRPLLARAWDHVVLQAYSTLDRNAPGDASTLIDASARLASLFHSMNPRVDVRLVASWSRADQTYLQTGHWFGKPIEAMALDVRAACERAVEHALYIESIVPVGQAWNHAIGSGVAARNPYEEIRPGQINLWGSDSYHASTFGYYLEALVIFGSITGRDPRVLGAGETAASELGIAGAMAVELQKIAFETLEKESPR